MKLYPKELKSLKDLEKEKKMLKKQARRLDKEDIFSVNGLLGKGKAKDKDKDDDDHKNSLLDLIPISNPIVSVLLGVLQRRLMGGKKLSGKQGFTPAHSNPVAGIAMKIGKEFIGGYIKWKAIELAFKGAKMIVKKVKEKRAEKVVVVL